MCKLVLLMASCMKATNSFCEGLSIAQLEKHDNQNICWSAQQRFYIRAKNSKDPSNKIPHVRIGTDSLYALLKPTKNSQKRYFACNYKYQVFNFES